MKTLYPFQRSGAAFLASNVHALLADEMGLGKTVQAIAAVERLGLRQILVVCPASVRLTWAQEIKDCGSLASWHIISYNQAASAVGATKQYDAIILDEVHFCKTPKSQRTQAIFGAAGFARRAKYKWCLSGTPILNRPIEAYPMLKTLACHVIAPYDTFERYARYFCGAYWDQYSLNVKGATHTDELAQRLKGFMLRRTIEEVMPDLPPAIISHIPLDVPAAQLREVFAEEQRINAREAKLSPASEDFSQLGDISTLLRLTGLAKLGPAASFIWDLLETQEKVVVFAHHRDVISMLAGRMSTTGYGCVVYQGGMSDAEKQAAVQRFVTDKNCRVFVGNIKAAGTGINGLQQVASSAVFAELSWTPGEIDQAIGRLRRHGQTAKTVNAYILHAPETLEAAMLGVLRSKRAVIGRVLDGDILEGIR